MALQSDIQGSPDPGVALQIRYDIAHQEIECVALVGNQVIRSTVPNVKKDMFEDRFFVLSITTHPYGFKVRQVQLTTTYCLVLCFRTIGAIIGL